MAHDAKRRALICAGVLGLLLAATMAAMVDVILFREMAALGSSPHRTLILIGACIVTFACGAGGGYLIMRKGPAWIERASAHDPWKWMPLSWKPGPIVRAAALMLVCWLPYIVIRYPGGMNFDTYVEIYQFMDPAPTFYDTTHAYFNAEYIDHHPVFDTLVYGSFFWIGNAIGSQMLGLFACTLFQCALSAGALAAMCCYMERLGVPKPFRIVSLAFCALFPFIPLWATTLMKDSLHAPLFLSFMICYVEAFRTRGEALKSRGWLVGLIVFACLVGLTKKTGLAVAIVSLVVLAAYCKLAGRGARIACALAVPIVYFGVFSLVVCNLIGGVAPGGTQEGLGFAMQQVVSVVIEDDDLTAEEREQVGRVLDIDAAVGGFELNSVDQVKNKAYASATRADYLAFLKAYVTIGLRHPLTYLRACLNVTAGFFCPGGMISQYDPHGPSSHFLDEYGPELEADGLVIGFEQPEALKQASDALTAFFDSIKGTPFARFFFGRGLFSGWIPLICLMVCLSRDKRYFIAFVPVLASMALLLICPVVSSRYMLMLVHACPLLLALACHALNAGTGTRAVFQRLGV